MKNNKIWNSLFLLLLSSCITVKRIDKKDSNNNNFSTQLQNWIAVKHPQKIDTNTIIRSDTTVQYVINGGIDTGVISDLPDYNMTELDTVITDINSGVWTPIIGASQIPVGRNSVTKVITIRDTIEKEIINVSQLNALNAYLNASRDSTNMYMLKYSKETSTALKRLIAIIVMGLALVVCIYLLIKKAIL